jgi:hypothetical protein
MKNITLRVIKHTILYIYSRNQQLISIAVQINFKKNVEGQKKLKVIINNVFIFVLKTNFKTNDFIFNYL